MIVLTVDQQNLQFLASPSRENREQDKPQGKEDGKRST
jgi:hypothetical protein